MNAPIRGCIYWTRIPDEPRGKQRPAVVLSLDVRNRLASDVIVVPLSSRLRESPTHVFLKAGEGGLPERSAAKCEQVTTIVKDSLLEPALGGPLSAARLRQIERAVLIAIGIFTEAP